MDSGTHLVKWMDFLRYPSGRKSSCRQRCGWRGGGGDGALAAARPRKGTKREPHGLAHGSENWFLVFQMVLICFGCRS